MPNYTWANCQPMTNEEIRLVRLLREGGCRCQYPLLGYIPKFGPRCRMCQTLVMDTKIDKEVSDG